MPDIRDLLGTTEGWLEEMDDADMPRLARCVKIHYKWDEEGDGYVNELVKALYPHGQAEGEEAPTRVRILIESDTVENPDTMCWEIHIRTRWLFIEGQSFDAVPGKEVGFGRGIDPIYHCMLDDYALDQARLDRYDLEMRRLAVEVDAFLLKLNPWRE